GDTKRFALRQHGGQVGRETIKPLQNGRNRNEDRAEGFLEIARDERWQAKTAPNANRIGRNGPANAKGCCARHLAYGILRKALGRLLGFRCLHFGSSGSACHGFIQTAGRLIAVRQRPGRPPWLQAGLGSWPPWSNRGS